mmetsp:Transcript_27081/g.49899  ORF Transcript_27081/g.49899 Transcript_27081/m.49899 type:complete len:294 (-) Transcript_27081:56-937(-)
MLLTQSQTESILDCFIKSTSSNLFENKESFQKTFQTLLSKIATSTIELEDLTSKIKQAREEAIAADLQRYASLESAAAAATADLPSNNASLTTSDVAIAAVNSTAAVDNVVANTTNNATNFTTNIINTTTNNSTNKTAANEMSRPTSAVADLEPNAQNLEAIAAASQEDSQSQEVLNSIAQPIATSAFRGVVRIAPDLDSAKLLIALSSVKTAKVLHFRTLVGAVKDFGLGLTHSPDAKQKFMRRLQVYGSIWCCVNNHPGHVHYDLLWDVPHTDKFNRVWSENNTWVQLPGP